MTPHKKSGKAAQFQTRDEAALEALARNDNPDTAHPDNVHEIVRKGDTYQSEGRDILHKADVITAENIRIVVPNGDGTYAFVGPWNKAAERSKMEKDWDAANA